LYALKEICPAVLERVLRVKALPEQWRDALRKRTGRPTAQHLDLR